VRTIFGGPDLNLAAKLLSPQKDRISTKPDLEYQSMVPSIDSFEESGLIVFGQRR